MEFGLTFPLQRFLRLAPPKSLQPPPPHSWDAHVIDLRGQKSLLAVHCATRYAVVLFSLTEAQWRDLRGTFFAGLRESLRAAGLPCGEDVPPKAFNLTRTHGRREVAFLNRAWEDTLRLEYAVDTASLHQPLLEHGLNNILCRCAGEDGIGRPLERMAAYLKENPTW